MAEDGENTSRGGGRGVEAEGRQRLNPGHEIPGKRLWSSKSLISVGLVRQLPRRNFLSPQSHTLELLRQRTKWIVVRTRWTRMDKYASDEEA